MNHKFKFKVGEYVLLDYSEYPEGTIILIKDAMTKLADNYYRVTLIKHPNMDLFNNHMWINALDLEEDSLSLGTDFNLVELLYL